MISVLFVCRGNICRSPALQAVLESIVQKNGKQDDYMIDSAGIDKWFLGDDPDSRMQHVANKEGIVLRHKAKVFEDNDFYQHDYIFAVNHDIYAYLLSIVPTKKMQNKIYMATDFSEKHKDKEIADPYYGSKPNFEKVFTMIKETAQSIYEHLEKQIEKKKQAK
jgi:protein-tyrosine phosphatase